MNTRLERVGKLIRDEISDLLHRDLHDPLIGFVTITEVKVSSDLRHATVFFSVLGNPEQVAASTKGLLRARKYLNARLGERLDLRFTPKLRFRLDETAARAQRLESILHTEHDKFGEAPPPEPVDLDALAAEGDEEDDEEWDDDEEE